MSKTELAIRRGRSLRRWKDGVKDHMSKGEIEL